MHFYCITRGVKPNIDRFISDLQAQYWPFEYTNPVTKEKCNLVQMGVRPIQFWEMVFPKESMNEALKTMLVCQPTLSKNQERLAALMRKCLNAKKIPEIPPETRRRIVFDRDLEVTPIGIKEDKMHPQGHEML